MSAWTDAIDEQLDKLADQLEAEVAQRVFLGEQLIFATGQRVAEILRAVEILDEETAQRVLWRTVLIDARALGYLPDPKSRFYSEEPGVLQ